MESKGEVIIYQTEDGKNELNVKLQSETVWLNQYQMADLFDTDRTSIQKHIQNIYKTKELLEEATCAKFAQVRKEGSRTVERNVQHYNLDVIISVGYRVNSKRGTQFRIWATQTLKDHLVKGFTINKKRLQEQQEKFTELHQTVEFLKTTLGTKDLSSKEAKGLLEIISNYTRSFVLLNQFDRNALDENLPGKELTHEINYKEALIAVEKLKQELILKKEATELFGRQRGEDFGGILNSIVQTFGGTYLYPSVEEQAAHLLYFVIKNHPFADGNKRIGAFYLCGFCT